jgi:hypothetical protein
MSVVTNDGYCEAAVSKYKLFRGKLVQFRTGLEQGSVDDCDTFSIMRG